MHILQGIFSVIQYPANYSFVETLSSIQGKAHSYSLLKTTRISFQRLSDNYFFNGTSWSASEAWIDSMGTEKWVYPLKSGILDYGVSYKICSKASDTSGAEESPGNESVFTYVFSTNIANSVAAYPNPFLPGHGTELVFEYFLPMASPVRISIYSVCGDVVKHYQGDGYETPGLHRVNWDGRNEKGFIVANGLYLFAMQAGNLKKTEKVIVLK